MGHMSYLYHSIANIYPFQMTLIRTINSKYPSQYLRKTRFRGTRGPGQKLGVESFLEGLETYIYIVA
jgi:hypothetical protein